MRFIGLALITEDVPRLAAFYGRAFGVKPEGDAVHSTLALPGLNLAIYSKEASIRDMKFSYPERARPDGKGDSPDNPGTATLMFAVDNVDGEYQRIKALGIPVMTEPTAYPWGSKAFHFRDSDGNIVDFVEPRKG